MHIYGLRIDKANDCSIILGCLDIPLEVAQSRL